MIATIAVLALLAQTPQDTGLVQYDVDGLHVIHHRRPARSNVIAVELYLLGGSRQLTDSTAGIETFLLTASEYGTQKYPGEATRRAIARAGVSMSVDAASDWTTFEFHGLKQDFDLAWSVFADRIMNPTLDSASIAIARKRMLGWAARRSSSPEEYAWFLADSTAFHDHPYAINPDGTELSIQAMTGARLRRYAAEQLVLSRMRLVVVGDLSREAVERAVHSTLGTLPRGDYKWTLPAAPQAPKTLIVAAPRASTTNYIVGTIVGPSRTSPDYLAFQRAMGLLGSWVSTVIREENSLSYDAGASVIERGSSSAALYISTNRPDSAMKLVNMVLHLYESDIVIPKYVLNEGAKRWTLEYIRDSETAAGEAELLGRAALYDGDPLAAARREQAMRKLNFYDLRNSVRAYAKHIRYAFVGDTSRVPREEMLKR